jgi:hypothetical protein
VDWLAFATSALSASFPGSRNKTADKERTHRTREEVVDPPRANIRAQQRALDVAQAVQ